MERITSKIYLVRGQKVMLDRDLGELYGVETKVLKQAVRRNLKRFPSDFMFELKVEEEKALRDPEYPKIPSAEKSKDNTNLELRKSGRDLYCYTLFGFFVSS